MSLGVSVEINSRALAGFLQQLEDGPGQFVRIVKEAMNLGIKLGVTAAKHRLSGDVLYARSGQLRNSIKGNVFIDGGFIVGQIGIIKPRLAKILAYGAAQEFGGQAAPVKAKVMTLPLAAALTPAGVTRFTALEAKQRFDRTFWWRDILYGVKAAQGKGKRVRGSKFGKAGDRKDKIIPLFWAAHHVKIGKGPGRGRHYLRDSRDELIRPMNQAIQLRVAELFANRRKNAEGA